MSTSDIIVPGPAAGFSCSLNSGRGGVITSVVSQGVELLADGHAPHPTLTRTSGFEQTGLAGWVDCFPSIAALPPAREGNVNGQGIADHGELWFREWQLSRRRAHGVDLRCPLPDLGIDATKSVEWTGDVLEVSTSLMNTSSEPLPYVLASHPLLACDDTSWLRLVDSAVRWESSSGWPELPRHLNQLWPADREERRWWRDLPVRTFAKIFVPWPGAGIEFGYAGRAWAMQWKGAPASGFLGLWLNREAHPQDAPLSHWAPEPTIGDCDSVEDAASRGTAGVLLPGATTSMTVRVVPVG
jgi:hypothetical protein